MRRIVVVVALLAAVLRAAWPQPVAAAGCAFALGFRALHDRLPAVVGACVDDEQHNPANGDALQRTTTGLLVWRKADNVTGFTDGFRTWLDGPYGVQERLNGQRFAWEVVVGGGAALLAPGDAGFVGFSGVAPYAQQHILSCEAAAASVALRLAGFAVAEGDLLARLPADPRQPVLRPDGSVVRWGDPDAGFVGRLDGWFPWSPGAQAAGPGTHGWGYGVYADALLPVVRRFDPGASGGTGIDLSQLEAATRAGRAAMVWLPDHALYRRDPARAVRLDHWTTWDGATASYMEGEHAQVVLGFTGDAVVVGNVGYRVYRTAFLNVWPRAEFAAAYRGLGDMAIIS